MHTIAHGECTDTVRESALKVDSGRKISCRTRESNLRRRRVGPMRYQLSYIPTPSRIFAYWSHKKRIQSVYCEQPVVLKENLVTTITFKVLCLSSILFQSFELLNCISDWIYRVRVLNHAQTECFFLWQIWFSTQRRIPVTGRFSSSHHAVPEVSESGHQSPITLAANTEGT